VIATGLGLANVLKPLAHCSLIKYLFVFDLDSFATVPSAEVGKLKLLHDSLEAIEDLNRIIPVIPGIGVANNKDVHD